MQLAVAQAEVTLGDVEANLATARKLLEQAQAACDSGLDLLVLPELFLTGYLLRDDYARVAEAVPGDGEAQAGLAMLAADSGVYIAAGLVERGRGSLYNVALLVGPGGYIGHYRKRVTFPILGRSRRSCTLPPVPTRRSSRHRLAASGCRYAMTSSSRRNRRRWRARAPKLS